AARRALARGARFAGARQGPEWRRLRFGGLERARGRRLGVGVVRFVFRAQTRGIAGYPAVPSRVEADGDEVGAERGFWRGGRGWGERQGREGPPARAVQLRGGRAFALRQHQAFFRSFAGCADREAEGIARWIRQRDRTRVFALEAGFGEAGRGVA